MDDTIDRSEDSRLADNFDYREDCGKYVMKDFQTRDIFEKNKDKMPENAIPMVLAAGRKLESNLKQLAESVQKRNLAVGSLVAPVWPPTGGGSAMGSDEERKATT